ncbi:amino acid ABC transporter permease [Roseomonas sp. OT10]|uniref:amino acid ABC transporter permease n=1 Tax=Roseomonas cutis TaxID=2897332 RepID=UPI001E44E1FE|nr:amino acid ABC transporter permease [Roseomonas sp. OT10]UFN48520.1 amino acid ABC transporter permease [Roseomonas sp. OT10]
MTRLLAYLDPTPVWQFRSLLLEGLANTVALALCTLVLAIPPALAIALGRRHGPAWLATPLTGLVWLARSVPAVMLVVFIYLALPFVGPAFSAFASTLIALTVAQTVYFSEVFRGALAAIGQGQWDAAHSLGMAPLHILARVIGPQAAVVGAAPFASSLVLLVQNTSIASAIALTDLTQAALAVQNMTTQPSPLVAAGLGYLAIILPLVRLTRRWERRVARAF